MSEQLLLGENLSRLQAWAKARNLKVTYSTGNQQEPDCIVTIQEDSESWRPAIISKISHDSVDTAAIYVLRALERLGAMDNIYAGLLPRD